MHSRIVLPLAPMLVALALLASAAPAAAIYEVTPLRLGLSHGQAEVGDEVRFELSAENETTQAQLANTDVRVRWVEEGKEPGAAASGTINALVRLDGKASAAFTWRVSADADDKNLHILVEDAAGQKLAQAYLTVGDAEPIARILAEGAPDEGQPEPVRQDQNQTTETGAGDDASGRRTPGLTAAFAIAGIAAAFLAVGRKR